MCYAKKFTVAIVLAMVSTNAQAGWNYGGLRTTSVRDNQTVRSSSLMFTSGTLPVSRPSAPIFRSRLVKAYAGNRDSRGVYVYQTSGRTTVSQFRGTWSVRLNGSRIPKNQWRRGFVYASSQLSGSSTVHAASMTDGLTFR